MIENNSKIPYESIKLPMPEVEIPAKFPPLEWNVFIFRDKFTIYNVFDHSSFKDHVATGAKKCKTKKEFAPLLMNNLRYYFWARAEWEVVLTPWIGSGEKKIDVYEQVMANWDLFLNYTWNYMKDMKDEPAY